MAKVFRSSVINAPVETVWSEIREFGAVAKWQPLVTESSIEDGRPGDSVGCIRSLTLKDGGTIRERLLALSDHEHFFTYSILDAPLPVENYVATLRLTPITEGNATYAQWTADFDTDADKEEQIRELVGSEIFQVGIDGLKEKLS